MACIISSFRLMVEYIFHILFIHGSVNGHLGVFYSLAIMNKAVLNICVQVFVEDQ